MAIVITGARLGEEQQRTEGKAVNESQLDPLIGAASYR